jgi:hypothetical protein
MKKHPSKKKLLHERKRAERRIAKEAKERAAKRKVRATVYLTESPEIVAKTIQL